jgi:homoserine kinase
VEGEGADELPRDGAHLGIRAFGLLAPTAGKRFRFTNRIPPARGLGSSAATIALGLVAASLLEGREPEPETLLARALELESHADNLAAALAGGVCLTWSANGRQRIARLARSLPLVPIALVPAERVDTESARAALPASVPHADAAFTAGRAALLGAGLASGDAVLLADAFQDRLHEPYRAASTPLLSLVRARPPVGAVGATVSGSGPTVVVWAAAPQASACAAELERDFPAARVLSLRVSASGACQ